MAIGSHRGEGGCSVRQLSIQQYLSLLEGVIRARSVRPLAEEEVCDLVTRLYHGDAIAPPILWRCGARLQLIDGERIAATMAAVLSGGALSLLFDPAAVRFSPKSLGIDSRWVCVSRLFAAGRSGLARSVRAFMAANPDGDPAYVCAALDKLLDIGRRFIHVIELNDAEGMHKVTGLRVRFRTPGSRVAQAQASLFITGQNALQERCYWRRDCRIALPHHAWFA